MSKEMHVTHAAVIYPSITRRPCCRYFRVDDSIQIDVLRDLYPGSPVIPIVPGSILAQPSRDGNSLIHVNDGSDIGTIGNVPFTLRPISEVILSITHFPPPLFTLQPPDH